MRKRIRSNVHLHRMFQWAVHGSVWESAGMRQAPESPVFQVILPLAHLPLFILLCLILFWDWATLWPPLYRLTLIFQESSCLCLLSTGLAGVCPTLCCPASSYCCFYPTSFFCLPLSFSSLCLSPFKPFSCVLFGWHRWPLYPLFPDKNLSPHPLWLTGWCLCIHGALRI